jgi:hypothetical protein
VSLNNLRIVTVNENTKQSYEVKNTKTTGNEIRVSAQSADSCEKLLSVALNYGLELASTEVSSAQLMILPDALTHRLYTLLFGA